MYLVGIFVLFNLYPKKASLEDKAFIVWNEEFYSFGN